MESDGYTLDDKRAKEEGYGDLQDIVIKYKSAKPAAENDRKRKYFTVPKKEIVAEGYDLSFSRYKEEVYEEIEYEKPEVILEKLMGENGLENQISQKLNELKELF